MKSLNLFLLYGFFALSDLSAQTLQERFEDVRSKELKPVGIAEARGAFVVDEGGRKRTLSLLRRVASEVVTKCTDDELLLVYTYLRDSDAKLRVVAFYVLNNELDTYKVSQFPFRALSERDQDGVSPAQAELLSRFSTAIIRRIRK